MEHPVTDMCSATNFQISPIFGPVASFDVSKFCLLAPCELLWGPGSKWVYSIKQTSETSSVQHREFDKMTHYFCEKNEAKFR